MEKQQFLKLLDTYEKKLKRLGHSTPLEVPLSRLINPLESRNLVLGYCYNMIKTMREQVAVGEMENDVQHWLGFIQGCFLTNGVYTIRQMQKHNRTKA